MSDCERESLLSCLLKIIGCLLAALLAILLMTMVLGGLSNILQKLLATIFDKAIASFLSDMLFALLYLWQALTIAWEAMRSLSALTARGAR